MFPPVSPQGKLLAYLGRDPIVHLTVELALPHAISGAAITAD